jgi:hypothetical protein
MVKMDHLSSSQINLYLLCGLKYKFQYIENLPRPFKSSALAFGSVIHSALSWIHDNRMQGEEVSLDMLYRIFDSDWYVQKLDTEIRYKDSEQELILELLGKEMLDLYLQLPQKKLKGSEIHFSVPLIDPVSKEKLPVNLEGFFDLIEADDIIAEFKTSAQTMNQEDVDSHIQLTAYGYAFKALFNKPAKGFKIVNFVKRKKPKIETFETQRNELHYQGFFFLAKSVLRGIQNKIFIPHMGYWCKECEYVFHCPLWMHLREHKRAQATISEMV